MVWAEDLTGVMAFPELALFVIFFVDCIFMGELFFEDFHGIWWRELLGVDDDDCDGGPNVGIWMDGWTDG